MNNFDNDFCYSFPAVRGQQAGRPCYTATCPLRIIPKIFMYDEPEVPPELRAQRLLNKSRIPEMTNYLVNNPHDYVLPALTASIISDTASVLSQVLFIESESSPNVGTIKISMNAKILINDGQHRRAAIEAAIKIMPELGQDNISVLLYVDEKLERCQQRFVDMNQNVVKSNPSINALYDKRNSAAKLAYDLATNTKPFINYTDMERTNIPAKSNKLFPLSGIKTASRMLLSKGTKEDFNDHEKVQVETFWEELNSYIIEWNTVRSNTLPINEFKENYIIAHGIGLQALAIVGRDLIKIPKKEREQHFKRFSLIDWTKTNWSKRSMLHGRLSTATSNKFLTATEIKRQIGLPITNEDLTKEKDLLNA
jgi:DNA sulfur modification protein DndB